MRISTNVLFNSGSARISELQSSLSKVQEQISTGRRILTPADDPVGAAQAMIARQGQQINEQYGVNRKSARNFLSHEESVLESVTGLLQDAKTLIVSAGNPAIDPQQRKYIATELAGIRDEMLGLANSTDGDGNYIFAGFNSKTQPFSATPAGAKYAGDQGQTLLEVGAGRRLAVSDHGASVFEAIRTGNGAFLTQQNPANTGSGLISPGTVVGNMTGQPYEIVFSVDPDTKETTYDIRDGDGALVSGGNPYKQGTAIGTAGWQVEIKGTPANFDKFTITPSKNESIFASLTTIIDSLNVTQPGAAGQALITNALSSANSSVTNALETVLGTRTSVGIRLKELDTLDSQGEARNIQYEQQLQDLEGLDYIAAVTELAKQKTILEAAQQSFVKTSGLSLFNFIQ
jgi:flagellar hook-associated protein 3 FlgL